MAAPQRYDCWVKYSSKSSLFSTYFTLGQSCQLTRPFVCALIRIQPRRATTCKYKRLKNCLHLASNLRDTPLASCSCMICGRVPHFQTAAEKRQDFTLTADSAQLTDHVTKPLHVRAKKWLQEEWVFLKVKIFPQMGEDWNVSGLVSPRHLENTPVFEAQLCRKHNLPVAIPTCLQETRSCHRRKMAFSRR